MKKLKKLYNLLLFIKQFPSNLNRLFKNYDKLEELRLAIIDPNGVGILNLKMKTIGVPKNCFHIFYEMPKNAICIDGGANIGLFTDLCLSQGAKIHLFEPNNYLVKNILEKKYKNNENVIINNTAIGVKNQKLTLFNSTNSINSIDETQGGSIINSFFAENYQGNNNVLKEEVNVINFCEYIKNNFILKNDNELPIYLCKIDIEGAEFDILIKIIEEKIDKYCKYIVVETHERMFKNGKEKLKNLKKLIEKNNIKNINLNWA